MEEDWRPISSPAVKALWSLAMVSSTGWHKNVSPRFFCKAPGSRWASVSTWNPLQMPTTGPPAAAKRSTAVITGENLAIIESDKIVIAIPIAYRGWRIDSDHLPRNPRRHQGSRVAATTTSGVPQRRQNRRSGALPTPQDRQASWPGPTGGSSTTTGSRRPDSRRWQPPVRR